MKKILVILAALTLAACVTRGTKFDMADVDAMKPGVTTIEDATAKLGKPRAVSTKPDGTKLLQWQYVEAAPLHARGGHVAVVFDKEGKMVRLAHKYE